MTDADEDPVLRLNEESVQALSPLDAEGLQRHRANAAWALVCEETGQVAAFTTPYAPGAPSASVNYACPPGHFDDFVYLDRIAVDPMFRRRGIAGALYEAVE